MTTKQHMFVQITKVFMLTPEQAQKALFVARTLHADQVMHYGEEDGTKISVSGDGYFTPGGQHDVAGAVCDLPDPERLLGIGLLTSEAKIMSAQDVVSTTGRTSKSWIEQMRDNAPK